MAETGAEILRQHRERAGVSMEELAEDVGVSEGAVWQWEAGRTTPRRAVALKADRRLGAQGAVARAFGYAVEATASEDQISSLRAELAAEREARHSEVRELRDQVEELIDQLAAIAATVDDLRQGGGAASPRAATE